MWSAMLPPPRQKGHGPHSCRNLATDVGFAAGANNTIISGPGVSRPAPPAPSPPVAPSPPTPPPRMDTASTMSGPAVPYPLSFFDVCILYVFSGPLRPDDSVEKFCADLKAACKMMDKDIDQIEHNFASDRVHRRTMCELDFGVYDAGLYSPPCFSFSHLLENGSKGKQ